MNFTSAFETWVGRYEIRSLNHIIQNSGEVKGVFSVMIKEVTMASGHNERHRDTFYFLQGHCTTLKKTFPNSNLAGSYRVADIFGGLHILNQL